jgi:hypothetical protein
VKNPPLLPTEEALLLPRTLAGLGVTERLAELGFADLRSYLTARYVGKHVAEVEIGRELLGHPAVWSIRAGLRALGIRRRYRVHHPERPQPVGHLEDGTPYFAPLAELRYDADVDRVQCHLCAGCGSPARSGLCGGSPVRAVPTAIDCRQDRRVPFVKLVSREALS